MKYLFRRNMRNIAEIARTERFHAAMRSERISNGSHEEIWRWCMSSGHCCDTSARRPDRLDPRRPTADRSTHRLLHAKIFIQLKKNASKKQVVNGLDLKFDKPYDMRGNVMGFL